MKIRPLEAELFHAGGQTDRQKDTTKLTVAFRNFGNRGRESTTPFILRRGSRWVSVVTLKPRSLYPKKNSGTHLLGG